MATRRRRERAQRILAKRYVATVRGRSLGGRRVHETVELTDKREAMREAKRLATAWDAAGLTIALRAGSARGGLIERLVSFYDPRTGRLRFRQTLET